MKHIISALKLSAVVVILTVFTLSLWDAASPFQASAAVGQLEDSASGYAASRFAATWNPFTTVICAASVLVAAIWFRALSRVWAEASKESS